MSEQKTAETKTLEQVQNEKFDNRLTINLALQMGIFNLQVHCVRNPAMPNTSFYFAYLAARPNVQAITDRFDSLGVSDLEDLLLQIPDNEMLVVGAGLSHIGAMTHLSQQLHKIGEVVETEADRLRFLMTVNDLLLTTTAKGVDFDEVVPAHVRTVSAWLEEHYNPKPTYPLDGEYVQSPPKWSSDLVMAPNEPTNLQPTGN